MNENETSSDNITEGQLKMKRFSLRRVEISMR